MSTAKEWFAQEEWAQGVSLKLHDSVDVDEFYKQYQAKPELWKAVFEFMKQDLAALEIGKYPLVDGQLTAIVSEYDSKEPENAKWEAHRKFIDLQYVISGEEKMGVMPLAEAKNAMEYNPDKDVIFYGENDGPMYPATPETYFLFFTSDLHRPGIKAAESVPVKKLVIKIATV